MRRLFILLFILASSLASAQKRPITHADMIKVLSVGNPEISPDGKWVVFSLNKNDYDSDKRHSDLWLVPTDGSSPARPITSGKAAESSPAWSPDGSKLLFTAKREGDSKTQLYLLDLRGGGEAQRITQLSSGASAPQWSPDGRYVLFNSKIYPDADTDSIQQRRTKAKKEAKIEAFVYDNFPVRSWDHWIDEQKTAFFVQAVHPDSPAVHLLAGDADFRERAFQPAYARWSADGTELLFVASTNYTEGAYREVQRSLFRIGIKGGSKRQISLPAAMQPGNLCFSRDGRFLYLTLTPGLDSIGKTYRHGRLARLAWPETGKPEYLKLEADLELSNLQFSADGKDLWLMAEQGGRNGIFRYELKSSKLFPFAAGHAGSFSGLSISSSGKTTQLVAGWQSSSNPQEIYRLDVGGSHFSPLTRFNQHLLDSLDLPRLQPMKSKTVGFAPEIESFLVLPPLFDSSKKYPLWVVMHGGPHSAWMDTWHSRWNYHLLASKGYVLLLTNYRGSTGYGEAFAQAIHLDPFEGPGNDIISAANEAIRLYPFIDTAKMVAGGASYGGHLANWMLARTHQFKCLISHAGLINSFSQWATSDAIYHREVGAGGVPWGSSEVWIQQNPLTYLQNFKTPMLLSIGEKDYRVPINNTLEAWNILQRLQVPSRLVVFPNENHWVQDPRNHKFFVEEMHRWIGLWLDKREE
ncbi:MAG: S9 family peptidase [Bacteroidia bacterium]